MGTEALRSTITKRLIFILYVLAILVIAVTTPSQKMAISPVVAEPVIPEPDPGPAIQVTPDATPVPLPAVVLPPPTTPEPDPPPSLPPDAMPLGSPYQFKDNNRRQIVSVAVRNSVVQGQYSYYYDDVYSPDLVSVYAPRGYKYLLVGITWDLVKVVGEGSRTTFRTPVPASYRLIHGRDSYEPVTPGSLTDPLHYYIKDQGSLAMDESIDKDNPGSGILIYEVPDNLCAADAYIEFCPQNGAIPKGEPHSPDTWDCTEHPVRWMLGK